MPYCTRCQEYGHHISRCIAKRCSTCKRLFDKSHDETANLNSLQQHMKTHLPKNVSCPICGDQKFASATNAVQHVESGYCRGCRGANNARNRIYGFVQGNEASRGLINSQFRAITNGSDYTGNTTPDFPYECSQCGKLFRQMSQLMQHSSDKHGQNFRSIGY